ncbi:MAG: hypothetical protein D6676_07505 [Cyanobacteria bacterium J003]|nr:MAG: hypothetical protein D6676_07505 [Cyanobacteria bacterium J003]
MTGEREGKIEHCPQDINKELLLRICHGIGKRARHILQFGHPNPHQKRAVLYQRHEVIGKGGRIIKMAWGRIIAIGFADPRDRG